jgi:ferredoxin-NADP reductase
MVGPDALQAGRTGVVKDGQADGPEATLELIVEGLEAAAEETLALVLQHPSGVELPDWSPGAHVDLVLSNGLVRQYSLCGDPRDRTRWRIAVLRERDSRGGSSFIHEHVQTGSRLTVRGPRNHFPLIAHSEYRFIAGGIGITPLVSMIAAADQASAQWGLLAGARTRASMPFLKELAIYGDRVRFIPQDERGLLDVGEFISGSPHGTAVYCCGPEALIRVAEKACDAFPEVSLYVERFAPSEHINHANGHAFEVHCRQSGLTLKVPPGKSILEVVVDAGIEVQSSCSEGTCGTCETDVLEGIPDHRDSFLSERERADNESMMLCVSRCQGPRLVLDL